MDRVLLHAYWQPLPIPLNTTGSSQGVEVLYGGELGSDSNTIIEATSSGDAVFQQADRWFISSDQGAETDPILTFVRYGMGSVQAVFDSLSTLGSTSLLSGLSTTEQGEIVNWEPVGTQSTPEPSTLLGLGSLLLLGGLSKRKGKNAENRDQK
ncbi:PEP-CTERM sorting domain-containing protein [Crocosphaera sp. UHCC 0190]|uniref:PEP-CTERM sorting domain-containing protein n=1 Tax=Crocosphaera sp. UHCC 0190 TaxID=3110246 RepID=UPI002B213134|nr:PEP-CTERM sorting domain-containing protein [Crocosphaera sp. UHCC 0190]MEA5511297.1 PEP-CTERM sorting domain-containing protein [Crocosphaera sp. UHCC 0190]